MSSQQLKQSLLQHKTDCQIKNKEDKLYITILIVLGIGSMLITAIFTLQSLNDKPNQNIIALGVVGMILLALGASWSYKNAKALEEANEKVKEFSRREHLTTHP